MRHSKCRCMQRLQRISDTLKARKLVAERLHGTLSQEAILDAFILEEGEWRQKPSTRHQRSHHAAQIWPFRSKLPRRSTTNPPSTTSNDPGLGAVFKIIMHATTLSLSSIEITGRVEGTAEEVQTVVQVMPERPPPRSRLESLPAEVRQLIFASLGLSTEVHDRILTDAERHVRAESTRITLPCRHHFHTGRATARVSTYGKHAKEWNTESAADNTLDLLTLSRLARTCSLFNTEISNLLYEHAILSLTVNNGHLGMVQVLTCDLQLNKFETMTLTMQATALSMWMTAADVINRYVFMLTNLVRGEPYPSNVKTLVFNLPLLARREVFATTANARIFEHQIRQVMEGWARWILGFSLIERLVVNGRDSGTAKLVVEREAGDREGLDERTAFEKHFRLGTGDKEATQRIVDFLVPCVRKWCVEGEGLQGDLVTVEDALIL